MVDVVIEAPFFADRLHGITPLPPEGSGMIRYGRQ
jgi:hypothetical protein